METYIVLTSPYSQVPVDSVQPVGITPVISTAWVQHSRAEVTLGLKSHVQSPSGPFISGIHCSSSFFWRFKVWCFTTAFPLTSICLY